MTRKDVAVINLYVVAVGLIPVEQWFIVNRMQTNGQRSGNTVGTSPWSAVYTPSSASVDSFLR
jgi:hypothetical protein